MTYKKFEDINVWQDSRVLTTRVYKLIGNNIKIQKDYSLADQLKRASYSIMLNIAEGFERKSRKEFANFLNIAKGSAGEVRAILYIMKDLTLISSSEFDALRLEVENISTQLFNFRNYLTDK